MKNINVKPYLARTLKAKKNEENEDCFPVYLRFNVNKVNHRISFKKIGYLTSEKDFEVYKDIIDLEIKYINDFVKLNKGKFNAELYNNYLISLNQKDRAISISQFSNKILISEFKKLDKIIDKRKNITSDNQIFIDNTSKLIDISNKFKDLIDLLDNWNKNNLV